MMPWKLWVTMALTFLVIVGVTALFLMPILALIGGLTPLALAILVALWVFIEWLIGPYIIEWSYKVKPADESYKWLHDIVERVSQRSRLGRIPKLMIADIPVPNAFAYGSWLTGPRIAVTKGILKVLKPDELEAVIGHEVGHLRHHDVQVITLLSVLPAIVYAISQALYYSGWFSSISSGRRNNGNSGFILVLIGIIGFIVYFILNLLLLAFSRQRETYADYNGATVVDNGAMKLAVALVKINNSTSEIRVRNPDTISSSSKFKALLISDPESAKPMAISGDEVVVYDLARKELTFSERFAELFSTHPHPVRRVKTLLQWSKQLNG
ncbi:MAG: zinc metalloprotease HtpX [Thermoprotei archaeon]